MGNHPGRLASRPPAGQIARVHRTPPADPQLAALARADARDGEWVDTPTGYVAYWVLERAAIAETGGGLSRREALALVAREVAARGGG